MMGVYGFKTKKELKNAIGQKIEFVETSMFGAEFKGDGKYTVVGPCPYTKRSWYATVTIKNGVLEKVT